MTSKIFEIPTVGPIEVAKHHRAKRITLRLSHNKNPKVVIPKLMTYKMGFNFAIEKQNWIIENQKKLASQKNYKTIFRNDSAFKTKYTNVIIKQEGTKPKAIKDGSNIYFYLPEQIIIEDEQNQKLIRNFIVEILRSEAKQYLIPRTITLAKHFGFKINKIFIKNLKSRWGSCSSINNINLNLHLVRLPEHLSDFIILHELCHTVHRNHGAEFHKLLNTITGDEKKLNRELKNYHIDF